MKTARWLVLFLCVAILCGSIPQELIAQELRRAPEKSYAAPAENFGFVPPRYELMNFEPDLQYRAAMLQPASWDWRALGGVTSVKNQNPYGTCWAFGFIGDLESKILINESYAPDFSEFNVVGCTPEDVMCNEGGNAWMACNYLSLAGTVEESCDPYPGDCPNPSCSNPACPFLERVTEWRIIPNDVTAIKEACMTYGPVYTSMYASFPGFSTYDGSYCLTYSGTENVNHAVLIVGWDDAMCGGAGGWIVKNSWGTSWGDDGYFYIRYGNARIGSYSSIVNGWKEYDASETIYHHDEWGWVSSVGYGDDNDWGMVVFTPTADDELTAIDFWASGGPTFYGIYIYDDFSGGALSNLLVGPITGGVDEEGYYSVDLASALPLTTGDAIYVAINFNTPGYNFPVPYDPDGPMGSNLCFVSNTGSTWEALDAGGYSYGDVGIRARVSPAYVPAPCIDDASALYLHPDYQFPEGVVDIYPGQTLGPYDLALCIEGSDTVCIHAEDTEGWYVTGDLDECGVYEDDCFGFWQLFVEAPLTAVIGEYDTVRAVLSLCDVNGVCAAACGVDTTTLVLYVVEPPPSIEVFCAELTEVDQGVNQAYVPFEICNANPASSPRDYGYNITSLGLVGPAIDQSGTLLNVPGGDCGNVYGVIDASSASVDDTDTLTIIAWTGSGEDVAYDTCVQAIIIVEPVPVPLLSPAALALICLGAVASAALLMRRRYGTA
jgi:C1A family cysteine protease